MATRYAVATGNWSSTSTWDGGTLPDVGDVVYADGKTITIDINVTVVEIRNDTRSGGTSGGTFIMNNGVVITANLYGATGTYNFYTAANASVIIVGNVYAFATNWYATIIALNGGTITVNGNLYGSGSGASFTAMLGANGTLIVNGDVYGGGANAASAIWLGPGNGGPYGNNMNLTVNGTVYGPSDTRATAINVASATCTVTINNISGASGTLGTAVSNGAAATITVTGNIAGGSTTVLCLSNSSTGTVNVLGNVTGGLGTSTTAGITNSSTGVINIAGTAMGGTGGGPGISNTSTGTVNVSGTIKGNGWGPGSSGIATAGYGVSNTNQNGKVYAKKFALGDRGQFPVSGTTYLTPDSANVITLRTATPNFTTRDHYNATSTTLGAPATTNVRSGITYAMGTLTGTMVVPSASNVSIGVAVDNTTGTLNMVADFWNAMTSSMSTSGSIGERLKNAATVDTTGQTWGS